MEKKDVVYKGMLLLQGNLSTGELLFGLSLGGPVVCFSYITKELRFHQHSGSLTAMGDQMVP